MSAQSHPADDAAAAWDARLRRAQMTEADHKAFQAWLQEDPEHQFAYGRLQAALRLLRAEADLPELSALRDAARSRVTTSKRRRLASVLALAAAVAGISLVTALPQAPRSPVALAELHDTEKYATSLQETKRVILADGSRITLDSGTQITVRLQRDRRDVTLVSGRALFKVAKDATRPFTVMAGNRTITALGTVFDVRVSPRELRVTLAEGLVAVRPTARDRRAAQQILQPRQQLVAVSGRDAPILRTVDIQNALAWADRQFFFEDEPLVSAFDEINRNGDLTIIADSSVAGLRINGMFRVSDEAAFVRALKLALPVDVRRDALGRLIVSKPAAGKTAET